MIRANRTVALFFVVALMLPLSGGMMSPAQTQAATSCPTRFTPVRTPHPAGIQSQLGSVERVPGTRQAWAVGNEQVSATGRSIAYALHYANGSWKVVSIPNRSGYSQYLSDLTVISATNIWAVGQREPAVAGGGEIFAHWNGSKWSVIVGPTDGNLTGSVYLSAIAAAGASNIWAVGTSDAGPVAAHYNGSSWKPTRWPTRRRFVADGALLVVNPVGPSVESGTGRLRVHSEDALASGASVELSPYQAGGGRGGALCAHCAA